MILLFLCTSHGSKPVQSLDKHQNLRDEIIHMEMLYHGAIIRPIVSQTNGVFCSSVLIRDPQGHHQLYEGIGRFASDKAASFFAVNWAIARLDGEEELKPPFRMLDGRGS
jgi:hypothetical protein